VTSAVPHPANPVHPVYSPAPQVAKPFGKSYFGRGTRTFANSPTHELESAPINPVLRLGKLGHANQGNSNPIKPPPHAGSKLDRLVADGYARNHASARYLLEIDLN
jgi:hypothetical protein